MYQFNRILDHFASDQFLSVHIYPTYSGRFSEVTFNVSKNLAYFDIDPSLFRNAFYEYLQSNGSIGISRQKIEFDVEYKTLIDIETLVSNTIRSYTESELFTILGWKKEFSIYQPENRKNLGYGKFRSQIDVLVYSFCFRTKKSITDIIRNLPGQQSLEIYRSALTLSLLGYLKIEDSHNSPERVEKMEQPKTLNDNLPPVKGTTENKNGDKTQLQANALKRLFNKIMSI